MPLKLTEGFSPHPKIKIEPALKLGMESSDLRAEIALGEEVSPDEAKERLEKELPDGIKIIGVEANVKRDNS